jgi:hypothetical protein
MQNRVKGPQSLHVALLPVMQLLHPDYELQGRHEEAPPPGGFGGVHLIQRKWRSAGAEKQRRRHREGRSTEKVHGQCDTNSRDFRR